MKTYNSFYAHALSLNAALGSLCYGYLNAVMNPLISYIPENVYTNIDDSFMTLTTSLVPAGAAVGAFVISNIAKRIGRRNAMFVTDAVAILGVVITLIGSPYCLLIGRLISGLIVGFNSSLIPLYISEVSPAEIRGVTGSFMNSTGILVSYLFGLNVPIGHDYSDTKWWWRFMLGFGILLAISRSIILLVGFRCETPKYLLENNKEEEATKALEKIYHKDQVAEQLILLKKEKEANAQTGKLSFKDLFSVQYRSRLAIGCFLAALQQFSGINAIIYFSTSIFEDPNDPYSKKPQIYTVILGVFILLGAIFATLVVKRFGRHQLLLSGTMVCFIALVILPIIGWAAPDAGSVKKYFIFLFIFGNIFSLCSVVFVYIGEILPDLGIGLATLTMWVSCVIVAQAFPSLNDGIGPEATFMIFAVITLAGFFVILKWVPETKGKEPHEIAALFGGKSVQNANIIDVPSRKGTDSATDAQSNPEELEAKV